MPALADTPNVQLLSGFSPSMLKLLMEGQEATLPDMPIPIGGGAEGEGGDATAPSKAPLVTPAETYRKAIDDPAYQALRERVAWALARTESDAAACLPPLPPTATALAAAAGAADLS